MAACKTLNTGSRTLENPWRALARLEVTKQNGKILCVLSPMEEELGSFGSPSLWPSVTMLNPKHSVLAQPFPVRSNNHGNEIPAKMKGADFH